MTLFVDRSLGRHLVVDALRFDGHEVIAHDDEFEQDTDDTVWLARAGSESWIVLMKDDKIRYRPLEKAALDEFGVRAFVLASGHLTGAEQAAVFVAQAQAILDHAEQNAGPYVVGVYRDAPLRQLYPAQMRGRLRSG